MNSLHVPILNTKNVNCHSACSFVSTVLHYIIACINSSDVSTPLDHVVSSAPRPTSLSICLVAMLTKAIVNFVCICIQCVALLQEEMSHVN